MMGIESCGMLILSLIHIYLQDKTGRIQLYARKDEMDEEDYNRFKKYDIGDIVGIDGEVFRTQRGEMSVRAKKITLLSKSLLPLPEKFHGLTDKETRYRPVSYTHLHRARDSVSRRCRA